MAAVGSSRPRAARKPMRRWSSVSEVLHALLVITVVAAAPLRCKNQHQPDSDCDRWASSGECEANAGFMKQQCAASCKSCGWKDTRCTDRSHLRPAKSNGQIAATFERALTFTEYSPTVHSRPPHGPWVVTFDNFVSVEEADAFVDTTDHHFQRSLAGDIVSPVRTSQQAWCQYGIAPDCVDHPLVHRVHDRVVNVTGVPKPNAEFFQVLRYEPGQFYKVRAPPRARGAGPTPCATPRHVPPHLARPRARTRCHG